MGSTEQMAVIVAILTGLLTALKGIKYVADRTQYLPFASVILGVGLSYIVAGFTPSTEPLLQGLIIGLSACGLYDVVSAKTKAK
jgi:hypothetical protein